MTYRPPCPTPWVALSQAVRKHVAGVHYDADIAELLGVTPAYLSRALKGDGGTNLNLVLQAMHRLADAAPVPLELTYTPGFGGGWLVSRLLSPFDDGPTAANTADNVVTDG